MHPATSVIFFTTASGAGYGLLFLLGLAGASGMLPAHPGLGITGFVLSLGLITAGLLSSTFHLGHPERAWRALSQWRSSWLSREGVAAVLTYVPAVLYGYGWVFLGEIREIWGVFGILASLGAVATVIFTAMIYASLPTIRQWQHPMTLPGYLIMGLAAGALWFALLVNVFGYDATGAMILALVSSLLAGGLKIAYWRSIDTGPVRATSGTATGLSELGRVRLLEAPTTSQNFVMREMGYRVGRKHADKLRRIALVLLTIIPVAMLGLALVYQGSGVELFPLMVAAVIGSLGTVVERWLFFAEATHVVTTYYGSEAA